MNILNKQDGIALITSLVLTLLSLVMIMVLMSFVIQGVRVSGGTKRYANALEASYGGAEMVAKELIPAFFNFASTSSDAIADMQGTYSNISLIFKPDNPTKANACMLEKLNKVTTSWDAGVCGAEMANIDPKDHPDIQFTLSPTLVGFNNGAGGYNVYAKIIDTAVAGNTYKSRVDYEIKCPGCDRDNSSSPAPIPSLYTIEITGEPQGNPMERVRLEVLYSY